MALASDRDAADGGIPAFGDGLRACLKIEWGDKPLGGQTLREMPGKDRCEKGDTIRLEQRHLAFPARRRPLSWRGHFFSWG